MTDPQATVSVSVTGIASNGFISRTEWAISACSFHGTVSVEYCKSKCKLKNHCKIYLEIPDDRVKVQFT